MGLFHSFLHCSVVSKGSDEKSVLRSHVERKGRMIKEDIEEEKKLRQTIRIQESLQFTECLLCQALCWTLHTKPLQKLYELMLLSCLGDEELETQTGEKPCPHKGKNSCLPYSTTPLNHTAPSPNSRVRKHWRAFSTGAAERSSAQTCFGYMF